jgi:hypothetical protein
MKKFVFVLMPFNTSFDDIYNYGIKQTCTELNSYCERVDEQIFSERILDRIYNQISKADIIIADMTGRNPNVFYEVGYAHGIGKKVILLTQNSDDIPFDLKHFPHIIYNGKIKILSDQLTKKLDWFLNADSSDVIDALDFNMDFLIDGTKIVEGTIIDLTTSENLFAILGHLQLDLFNKSNKTYHTKFKVGLEFESEYENLIEGLERIRPTTNKVLFVSKKIANIYPQAYKSLNFTLKTPSSQIVEEKLINCYLKIFTAYELKQIKFAFKVKTKIDFSF